jgi:hypothetical protein
VTLQPVSLIESIWTQFAILLPAHPEIDPAHPLGCHRHRVSDSVVFDQGIAALVYGSGYERIASPGCSNCPIRRRLKAWGDLLGQLTHADLQLVLGSSGDARA